MEISEENYHNTKWKWVNLISILIIILASILMVVKIWYDSKIMASPFLPKYTVIYANGSGINAFCFFIGGLIPTIYLRARKKYLTSTICLFLFIIIGILMKDAFSFYEHFYGLSRYLG